MLKQSLDLFYRFFPGLRRAINRQWYEYLSFRDDDADMIFMNYGYASLDGESPGPLLEPDDEPHRYAIQLYHHLAGAIDLSGLTVLEVGCGRGGGSAYVMRYLKPQSYLGVDLTARAITFCQRHYAHIPGLSFRRGNAAALDLEDESFEVVLNVESSHCYPNVTAFFSEVYRVLKPKGYFLHADFRDQADLTTWQEQLAASGLVCLKKEEITPNVIQALDLDNTRKRRLIEQKIPRPLHKPFNEFAGMQGSRLFYGAFQRGEKVYFNFILQKPA